MKALLLALKVDAWGHGFIRLLHRLGKAIDIKKDVKSNILEKCQELDRQYVQPHYPNGFATEYPAEYYIEKDAEVNLKNAEFILRFVEEKIISITSTE